MLKNYQNIVPKMLKVLLRALFRTAAKSLTVPPDLFDVVITEDGDPDETEVEIDP